MKPDVLILENLYLSMLSEAGQNTVKTFSDVYDIYRGKDFVTPEEYQEVVKEFNQKDATTNREKFGEDYAKDIVTVGGSVDRRASGDNEAYNAALRTNKELQKMRGGVGQVMKGLLDKNKIKPTVSGMTEAFPENGFPANIDTFFNSPEFLERASNTKEIQKLGNQYKYSLVDDLKGSIGSYKNSIASAKDETTRKNAEKRVAHYTKIIERLSGIIDNFLPSQKVDPSSVISYGPVIDLITRSYNYCVQTLGAPFTNNLFSQKKMTPEQKIALFGKQGTGFGSNVFTFIYAFEKKFGLDFIKNNLADIKNLLSGDLAKFDFAPGNYRDTFNAIINKYSKRVEETPEIKGGSVKFFDKTGKNVILELPKMFDTSDFVIAMSDKLNELTGKGNIKFVKNGDSYVAKFDTKLKFVPETDTGNKIYDILTGKTLASSHVPAAANESTETLEDMYLVLCREQTEDGDESEQQKVKHNLRKSVTIGYVDKIDVVNQKGIVTGTSSAILLENLMDVINFAISDMFDVFNTQNNMKADPEAFYLTSSLDKGFFKFGKAYGLGEMEDVLDEVSKTGDDKFIQNLNILIGN